MRDILFRGKRPDNGEWAYGYLFVSDADNSTFIVCGSWSVKIEFDVDPATVGQYTGLTDKNGVKIFEGDVVRVVYDGGENIFVVVWDNDELDFKATNGKENYGPGGFQYMPCCDEVEVIGNIHDNSEFMNDT